MRSLRIKSRETAYYHVMSRIIERRFLFQNRQKYVFRLMMRRVAEFSDVDILSYCIMDNHFHILLRIRKQEEISDETLLSRINSLYSGEEYKKILEDYIRSKTNETLHNAFRKKYMRRMNDLSEFMKTLKQRFSIYYNRTNERLGTLWEDRFKSVLLESPATESGRRALLMVGAYIDLNALRAGIVDVPMHYSWCSAGESFLNVQKGRGNCVAVSEQITFLGYVLRDPASSVEEWIAWYYDYICASGENDWSTMTGRNGDSQNGKDMKSLHCRNRFLSDGLILGGRSFVASALNKYSNCRVSVRKRRSYDVGDQNLVVAKKFRRELLARSV